MALLQSKQWLKKELLKLFPKRLLRNIGVILNHILDMRDQLRYAGHQLSYKYWEKSFYIPPILFAPLKEETGPK